MCLFMLCIMYIYISSYLFILVISFLWMFYQIAMNMVALSEENLDLRGQIWRSKLRKRGKMSAFGLTGLKSCCVYSGGSGRMHFFAFLFPGLTCIPRCVAPSSASKPAMGGHTSSLWCWPSCLPLLLTTTHVITLGPTVWSRIISSISMSADYQS